MVQKVKLSKKQLASIQEVQAQRIVLNNKLQEANQKETMILELILEMHKVEGVITNVQLENDELIITTGEKREPKGKKVKKIEEAPQKAPQKG